MQTQISTYSTRRAYNDCCLFVLSVGNNSGKVLEGLCPNCFVLECKSLSEKIMYKNLVTMLFMGKAFEPLLVGSVYPFLRIAEFKKMIRDYKYLLQQAAFSHTAKKAEELNTLKIRLLKNIALIDDARLAIYKRHLSKK